MARFCEPTAKQESDWKKWVAKRPPHVRAVAEKFDLWSLYLHRPTDKRVTVVGFDDENGKVTVRMNVTGEFNLVLFDRMVFGSDPDDFEPCELPTKDEMTGAIMSPEQVDESIDCLRLMVRPDLWESDTDGKAVRKA